MKWDGGFIFPMERRLGLILAYLAIVMIQQPLAVEALGVYGQETYYDDKTTVWVRTPIDIWYGNESNGFVEWPIYVEIHAKSYTETRWFGRPLGNMDIRFVPERVIVEVWADDRSFSSSPSWLSFSDCVLDANVYGTISEKKLESGTTEIYHPINEASEDWYKLVRYEASVPNACGINCADWGISYMLNISNTEARLRDGHGFTFYVKVETVWHGWVQTWLGPVNTSFEESSSHSFYMGDGDPNTDAILYLLEANQTLPKQHC
jgi:hypothetical protein